jgi:hypothetical protein
MRIAFAALLALAVPCGCSLNVENNRHANSAKVARHGQHQLQQTQQGKKDVPGGPREQAWAMFEKPTVPFSYVNIRGWDDQWYTTDPAAQEFEIPKGHIQIPNPNDFSMKPNIIAPEDRWPASSQESAHDVDSNLRKHVFQQAASMGGTRRFGPAWFMRNYRPVLAPEDKVPQEFYTYFKHVEEKSKKGKGKGKAAALTSLRGKEKDASAEGQAEDIAEQAAAGADAIEQQMGKAIKVTPAEGKDNTLALAEKAMLDGATAAIEAEKEDADLKHKENQITTTSTTTTTFHFTP